MRILLIITLIAVTGLSAYLHFGGQKDKEVAIVGTVLQFQNHLHFLKTPIDDTFSEETFDTYVESLDFQKRFFVQDEIDQLMAYKTQLDDESMKGTVEFFGMSVDMINNAIDRTKDIYKNILDQAFDFEKDEHVEMDGEKKAYATDMDELKSNWKKLLKYETLTKLASSISKQDKLYAVSTELQKQKYDIL